MGNPSAPLTREWQSYAPLNSFMAQLGPTWRRLRDGRIEHAFDASEIHRNSNGVVHGGMLMTFADYVLGYAARMDHQEQRSVTISLKVDFVSAARIGERISCTAEIVRRTRSLYFMRGDVLVGTRIVATASGVWKILGS